MSRTRPTIDDVAALSGVGRTTVSRVLNGGPNVRDEVRARVLNAVTSLGYRVNVQARFLAGGSSQRLALICAADPDAEPNSYYQSALEVGALRACSALGYQLLTRDAMPDPPAPAEAVLELIVAQRCDGVILTPPFSDDVELARLIRLRNCAIACVSPGRGMRGQAPGLGMDDEAAGHDMARHLLALGHRRFGFVHGIEGHLSADDRYKGVRRALREAGLDETAVTAVRGNFTFRSGVELVPAILAGTPRPTALICANDNMALGALFTAHRLGIAVPEALSVVGFDDTPASAIVWPPLTTVHQPIREMGYRAVELIVDQINTPGDNGDRPFELMAHELVVRQSSAPPAPSARARTAMAAGMRDGVR